MNIEEASLYLGISISDLKTLCELNLIKNNNYIFNKDDLDLYIKNRKAGKKYIPICDIEMLKNDRWEDR